MCHRSKACACHVSDLIDDLGQCYKRVLGVELLHGQ